MSRILLLPLAALVLVVAAACDESQGAPAGGSSAPVARASVEATGTPLPVRTRRPRTATASPSPTDTPTPEPTPVRPSCEQGVEERRQHYEEAKAEIEQAMAGYNGTWALGVIDLDCDLEFTINPEYVQYTASAGKIVPVIAALRRVQAGDLEFQEIEGHLDEILHHSNDYDADAVNEMVTPAQIQEVLSLAGVSDLTDFEQSWRYAFMPAIDLARVWEALMRGDLLNRKWTAYLLRLAAEVDLPPEYATFPGRLEREGYEYGQKAGYYVSDGIPYFMLGAGYLRPKDGSSRGFAMIFMMKTMNPDLFDPQRRSVFPILEKYLLDS